MRAKGSTRLPSGVKSPAKKPRPKRFGGGQSCSVARGAAGASAQTRAESPRRRTRSSEDSGSPTGSWAASTSSDGGAGSKETKRKVGRPRRLEGEAEVNNFIFQELQPAEKQHLLSLRYKIRTGELEKEKQVWTRSDHEVDQILLGLTPKALKLEADLALRRRRDAPKRAHGRIAWRTRTQPDDGEGVQLSHSSQPAPSSPNRAGILVTKTTATQTDWTMKSTQTQTNLF